MHSRSAEPGNQTQDLSYVKQESVVAFKGSCLTSQPFTFSGNRYALAIAQLWSLNNFVQFGLQIFGIIFTWNFKII